MQGQFGGESHGQVENVREVENYAFLSLYLHALLVSIRHVLHPAVHNIVQHVSPIPEIVMHPVAVEHHLPVLTRPLKILLDDGRWRRRAVRKRISNDGPCQSRLKSAFPTKNAAV